MLLLISTYFLMHYLLIIIFKNSENTSIKPFSFLEMFAIGLSSHSWELAAGKVSFFSVYDQITGPLVIPQKLADFSSNFVEVVLAIRGHAASLLTYTLAGNTGICLDDFSLVVAIAIFHALNCIDIKSPECSEFHC